MQKNKAIMIGAGGHARARADRTVEDIHRHGAATARPGAGVQDP